MKYYRFFYISWAYIISLIALLSLTGGLVNFDIYQVGIFGLLLVIWFGSMLYLKEKGKYSFYLSFFIVNLFWLPLFYRTYERVAFINKYGNFEGDDARGSPLAFVLGFKTIKNIKKLNINNY